MSPNNVGLKQKTQTNKEVLVKKALDNFLFLRGYREFPQCLKGGTVR